MFQDFNDISTVKKYYIVCLYHSQSLSILFNSRYCGLNKYLNLHCSSYFSSKSSSVLASKLCNGFVHIELLLTDLSPPESCWPSPCLCSSWNRMSLCKELLFKEILLISAGRFLEWTPELFEEELCTHKQWSHDHTVDSSRLLRFVVKNSSFCVMQLI